MNNRRPIYLMLAAGLCVLAILSFIPFAISKSWLYVERNPNANASHSQTSSQARQIKLANARPTFDAAAWYAERGEAPETHGVLIETFDGERVFASHNADEVFNPASLIKLSTSFVALRKLGADFHFQTKVFLDGEVDRSGVLRGSLYLSGNDPTFGDYGAALVAEELTRRGVKRIGDSIKVSPDFIFNFSETPDDSAQKLVKVLKLGNPSVEVAEQPQSAPVLIINSNPLSEILLYMNARSSNFIAERVGALIGGPEGMKQFLVSELKLPPDQVTIERASGREHNRMTPRGLLTIVRALVEEAQRQNLEPTDIMPVANDDSGTLRRRFEGTGLEGAVVGKTGTLTSEVDGGMASLAGIVYTQDQGVIVFAILDQGNQIAGNRLLEDQLLTDVINSQAKPRVVASPTPRRLLPSTGLRVERE